MSVTTWRVASFGCGVLCLGLWAQVIAEEKAAADKNVAGGAGNIQDYFAGGEPVAAESNEYITCDVKDKDLTEVLRFISHQVGVNVIADPELKEKVTVQFDRVEWRHALDVIAKQTHCRIVQVSDRLIRFTQPPSISMEFQDADIKVVLDLLAKQSGANIVIASDVQGKVSLSLREVPWREALQTLVETAGFVIVKSETESGNEILRVVRPESLKDQLYTEYFTLRYIRPDDPYVAIISDVAKYAASQFEGQGASGALEKGAAKEQGTFSLEEALRETLSKDGSLRYDANTSTLIVKDTKIKLAEIREIIKRVDLRPPQIYVEVKFIRTTNSDILERGVKFDLPGTPEVDGFQASLIAPEPNSLATDPLFLYGGSYPFDLGKPEQLKDFAALGILDLTGTRALLKLVKTDENSRIVQEPTLTMLNNKAATIFVGDEVPFAVQKIQQDQNGNITVAIEENKRSPINVGFTLYLIPHVVPDTDTIDLTVIPKVSALTGTTSDIEGFEEFSFETTSSDTLAKIDLPRQSLQTVVTYLRVYDGHTAVIGGLQTERKKEIESKIPLLSSIPVLGNLFTWKRKQTNVESMIILITPHIVKNVGEEDARFNKALEKHQAKDFFYQKYEKEPDEAGDAKEPAKETSPAPAGDAPSGQ